MADQCGDRLAVVISGDTPQCESGKLLSARLIDNGKGKTEAEEVFKSISEWNVQDSICAQCFDTTASNTGVNKGAGVELEKKLKRKLLWLPCRHHIAELHVESAYETVFGKDKSPYYKKFKEFQACWKDLDTRKYDPLMIDPWMQTKVPEIVQFCQNALSNDKIARNDYKECIELVLATLGFPPENFEFKKPGALHKARFMALIIYGLKIFLLRKVLKESRGEQTKLKRFAIFICLYYIRYWLLSPMASDAPFVDLKLYKDMLEFEQHDPQISHAVRNKLNGHTWYLGEEYAVFNLFSNYVPDQTKQKIVQKLLTVKPLKTYKFGPPIQPSLPSNIKSGMQKCVSDFVGERSHFLFDVLKFDKSWLHEPISTWKHNHSYCVMERYVKTLLVTNDCAERAIKLLSDYVDCLTKDSAERENLLQVVEAHRTIYKDCNKSTLSKEFSL